MTLCYQTIRTYKVCKIDLFRLHNYTNYTYHLVPPRIFGHILGHKRQVIVSGVRCGDCGNWD